MQPWEITLKRAIQTLPIWKQHAPGIKLRGEGHEVLEALIDQFEPMAQACVTSQDEVDDATRAAHEHAFRRQPTRRRRGRKTGRHR